MRVYPVIFLLLLYSVCIMVKSVISVRNNTPFNDKTHVYYITDYAVDTTNVMDWFSLDSIIQCGVVCVSNVSCVAAYYNPHKRTCMTSSEALNNFYMSPSYQAEVRGDDSVIYLDLEGWKSTTSTSTTSTTTTTASTTTTSTTTSTSTSTTTAATTQAPIDFQLGDRVRRGPDWSWGDQDGGPGSEGTITKVVGFAPGWTQVSWDIGPTNDYRNGAEGKVDLEKL